LKLKNDKPFLTLAFNFFLRPYTQAAAGAGMHSRTSSDFDGIKSDSSSIKNEEEEILFVVDITAPQINLEGKDAAG
jgi:hypothetical protein